MKDELLYIFDNADMVACIHNQEFTPHIEEIRDSAPDLKTFIHVQDESGCDPSAIDSIEYGQAMQGQSDARNFPERADEDLFILYTGGTTGMPKGVMWPHKAVFFAAMGGGGWFHPDGAVAEPEQIVDRVGDFR